jgi:nucleotide-binding universal stress UspA family protein
MYRQILVPVDLADITLARPGIEVAAEMVRVSGGALRLLNVLPITPMALAEYVPPDFETQQKKSAQDALEAMAKEYGLPPGRATAVVRRGGVDHEILEEAKAINADLIVMSSHRPAMRSYFLGSEADHVVRDAPCSVLVVRHTVISPE